MLRRHAVQVAPLRALLNAEHALGLIHDEEFLVLIGDFERAEKRLRRPVGQ